MFRGRALIIEDDQEIAAAIADSMAGLDGYLFDLKTSHDGKEGLSIAMNWLPDILIMDLGLPGMHGDLLLRELHKALPFLRIIVISASGSFQDKLKSLNSGADDYLDKPFSLVELSARVGVLLRRGKILHDTDLCFDDVYLNQAAKSLIYQGSTVKLTNRLFDLVNFLMQRPGQVVTRREIQQCVWKEKICYDNTVDANIERIRQETDRVFGTKFFKTAYNQGYYFDPHNL